MAAHQIVSRERGADRSLDSGVDMSSMESTNRSLSSQPHTLAKPGVTDMHSDLLHVTSGEVKYFDIVQRISSDLVSLRDTHAHLFGPGDGDWYLPQEIRNYVIDPERLVRQLVDRLRAVFPPCCHCQGGHRDETEMNSRYERTKAALIADNVALRIHIDEKAKDAEKLQENLKIKTRELDYMAHMNQELRERGAITTTTLEAQVQSNEAAPSECVNQLQEPQQKMDQHQNDADSKDQKIEDLQRYLDSNAKKIENLQRDLDSKATLIENLQRDLDSKAKEIEVLTSKNQSLKVKLANREDIEAELTQKKDELHELQQTVRNLQGTQERINRVRRWVNVHAACECVVPQSAHDDARLTPVLSQLLARVREQGCDVRMRGLAGPSIDGHVPVLLPCISASRVGSDISAALAKANIVSGARVILLIFHHLAPHNSRIGVPTEQRLSDRSLLDQCVGMVDAVFWNGAMYDCAANQTAVTRVQQLFRWTLSMDTINKLKEHL